MLSLCISFTAFACNWEQFTCKNLRCVRPSDVCDRHDDCRDFSDEDLCGHDYCPKWYYPCNNSSFCYRAHHHCDGKVDCPDASDEKNCGTRSCAITRCIHGACPLSAASCCQTVNGVCVVDQTANDALLKEMDTILAFTDGRTIHAVNLAHDGSQFLGQSDNSSITALTYSAEKNVIFWNAGRIIWESDLNERRKSWPRPVGEIGMECSISEMAYDWITGNFHIVCDHERVVVCAPRARTTFEPMLCTRATKYSMFISSITLHPNAGLVFLLGNIGSRFHLVEAKGDGSSSRNIYREANNRTYPLSKALSHLDIREHKIWFAEVWNRPNVTLRTLKPSHGLGNEWVTGLLGSLSRPAAVFPNLTIVSHLQEFYAVFFRDKIRVKNIRVSANSSRFSLIDAQAQPKAPNPCENSKCEHLCLLRPEGAVCDCDADYELLEDGLTCVAHSSKNKNALDVGWSRKTGSVTSESESRSIHLIHAAYLTVIFIGVICCGGAFWWSSFRRKTSRLRGAPLGAEARVSYIADPRAREIRTHLGIGNLLDADDCST